MTAPTRATYAALAAAAAGFVLYGSWVPFDFQPAPDGDAVGFFAECLRTRTAVHSRSDGLGNVLVAVPLGFFLLAAARADRPAGGDVLAAVALWPLVVAVAALAEFGQVFLPTRYCTFADIWCQGVGGAVGMAGWLIAGRWFTRQARAVWDRTRPEGVAGRLLVAYLVWVAAAQALPLDLTASPADVYRKLRDATVYRPFGELHADNVAAVAAKFVKLAGLFLPLGLLAGALPRMTARRVILLGAAFAAATEAGQLVVASRAASATDVVAGTFGVLAGWAAARGGRRAWAVGWAVLVAGAYWAPFDFWAHRAAFAWLPAGPLESGQPLFMVEDVLVKLALFAPLGAAAGRTRPGALAGGAASLVIELGQIFMPFHVPGVTDVLVGAAGGAAGGWAACAIHPAAKS